MDKLKQIFNKIKSTIANAWFFIGTLFLVVFIFICIKLYYVFFGKTSPKPDWVDELKKKLEKWNKDFEDAKKKREQQEEEWKKRREEANNLFLQGDKK